MHVLQHADPPGDLSITAPVPHQTIKDTVITDKHSVGAGDSREHSLPCKITSILVMLEADLVFLNG